RWAERTGNKCQCEHKPLQEREMWGVQTNPHAMTTPGMRIRAIRLQVLLRRSSPASGTSKMPASESALLDSEARLRAVILQRRYSTERSYCRQNHRHERNTDRSYPQRQDGPST